jgi:hypothetical protein
MESWNIGIMSQPPKTITHHKKGHFRQDEQDQLDILFILENNNPENLVNPV